MSLRLAILIRGNRSIVALLLTTIAAISRCDVVSAQEVFRNGNVV